MFKRLTVVLGLLALNGCATVADDRAKVQGIWKLVAYDLEFQDTGERRPVFGKSPKGYIIFTSEGRMMAYLEAEARKAPRTDEERAAAYRTMIAYTGKYRLEGDKWITKVDASWNVDWIGTDQERFYKFDGQQLQVVSQWNRAPTFNNRMVRGILVWERER
jgi:lipocalin-like protein